MSDEQPKQEDRDAPKPAKKPNGAAAKIKHRIIRRACCR